MFCTLLGSAPPLPAEDSVGLSPVGARTFADEDLLFFQPAPYDRFGWAVATGDFNHDGVADLAIGMPFHEGLVGDGLTDVGIVVVRWGVPGFGLAPGLADTVLSQYAGGSQSAPESTDRFGWALAVGDFNGDGHDDLAVGVPRDNVSQPAGCGGSFVTAGSVIVHYGLPGGIQTAGEHRAIESSLLPCDTTGDSFGEALAAGDFNGDGYDDLAVGVPGRDFGSEVDSGAVILFYGHFGGLVPWNAAYLSQASSQVDDTVEPGDRFGAALATGDVDGDGRADLVVGVPGEDGIGAAQLFLGTPGGIGDDRIFRAAAVAGTGAAGDAFGQALAAGDLDGDGWGDIAIGAPRVDLGAGIDAGRVSVIRGESDVLTAPIVASSVTQGSITGVPAEDGSDDRFGTSLVMADFDGDGVVDLAIGHPRKRYGSISSVGAVTVLAGGGADLDGRWRRFRPGEAGIPPVASEETTFGFALAAGDFDGDGHADLVIGQPQRDEGAIQELGLATVLRGSLFADGFESASLAYWASSLPTVASGVRPPGDEEER